MVAPRTLQALSVDRAFPFKALNLWLGKERERDNEPMNATIITILIAYVFVFMGDVNAVAEIISMFFLVTYGSLSLISFLNHFGSSPSYRPSFRSKWYFSLIGFVTAIWVMFKINTPYAIIALVSMSIIYLLINLYHKNRRGFEGIYANAIYQLSRNLQVHIQKKRAKKTYLEWRPSAICISKYSLERDNAFKLLDWISYKFGFGTYLHHIDGYYSRATHEQAEEELGKLLEKVHNKNSHVYIDTIISPSNTSAIAQAIQIPGIAGMENNMVIFEYDKNKPEQLNDIMDNVSLVSAGNFDIGILASSNIKINYKKPIHVWIRTIDTENANLLVLMSFIILGHPNWRKSNIKIFEIVNPDEVDSSKQRMKDLIQKGRLPINQNNIETIAHDELVSTKSLINEKSKDAGFTLIGFREDTLKHEKEKLFSGLDDLGNTLFVYSHSQKKIE